MVEDIECISEGAALRGLLFKPQKLSVRPPIVIMAHGTFFGTQRNGVTLPVGISFSCIIQAHCSMRRAINRQAS